MPAIDGLATKREGEEMRSLTLAVLIVVMLLVAAAAQASDKYIGMRRSHPAADLTSYAKYENVLDGIEAYQAGLLQLKSDTAQKDISRR